MDLTYVPIEPSEDVLTGESIPSALGVELDAGRREDALQRAETKRTEAAALRAQAEGLIRGAEVIERTWGIQPPCHLCGRRGGCGH